MRKRILSACMAICMLLTLAPVALATDPAPDPGPTTTEIAKIGDTGYSTLQAAVDAVTANQTITLQGDASGDGVVVKSGKNFTLDLDTHTYTISGDLVGSTNTKTNGFQLLKDTTLTIKNGTIAAENDETKILIQNYCNLTLDHVALTGVAATEYVLSNNNGEINLTGGTTITATEGNIAFDVCWAKAYTDGARVTVDDATINGAVELGLWGQTAYDGSKSVLTITGGTFKGDIAPDTSHTPADVKANVKISGGTFANDVSDYVLPDYQCKQDDSTYVVSLRTNASVGTSKENNATTTVIGGILDGTPDADSNVAVEDGTVTVSATTGGNNSADTDVTASTVAITPAALDSVKKSGTVDQVAIQTDVATLTVDKTAWGTITENATQGEEIKPVTLSVEKTEPGNNTPLTYTLTAKAGENDVFTPEKAAGSIQVSVSYEKEDTAPVPSVYYVSPTSSEKVEAVYEGGVLTWTAKHFSTYVVTPGTAEAMWMTNTAPVEGTFADAIKAVASTGGVVTLLKDVDNSNNNIYEEIGQNVTIQGNGHALKLIPFYDDSEGKVAALVVFDGATLTLDGVKLTITGETNATKGVGIDLLCGGDDEGDNTLKLINGSEVHLNNLSAGIRAAGADTADSNRSVIVENSTLTVENVTYASGGYMDITLDKATVTVDKCGAFGVAADTLTLKNGAALTVSNATNEGVIADRALTMDGTSQVSVSNCAAGVDKNAVSVGSGSRNNQVTGETALKLDSGATLSVTGSDTTVAVGASTKMDNQGTITGTVKPAAPGQDACQIIYTVDGQTYSVQTVSVTDGKATFTPPANPAKSGYTFTGWNYGSEVQGTTLTLIKNQTVYTYAAQWSRNSSSGGSSGGGGGSGSSNYTLTFDTNGGSSISRLTKSKGSTVDLTQYTPTRTGYTFDGWYTDKDLTEAVTTLKLTSSTTVYAKWTVKTAESTLPFVDVKTGDWFYDSVQYVYDQGMMTGTASNTFSPNSSTTRGMIVTILYRLEKSPTVSAASAFTDVAAGQWYADAVAWAAANNIVNGTSPTTFAPNAAITREQMAAILYRYAQFKGYDITNTEDLSKFSDQASISEYAVAAMSWANAEGLINGVGTNTLSPKGSATRGQVAAILARFCQNVVN